MGALENQRQTVSPVGSVGFSWATVLRALRPHQWVKNLLLFVPLILAHAFADGARDRPAPAS